MNAPGARPEQHEDTEVPFELGPGASARFVFAVAVFLSAFLLFQVQLLLGKFMLPWFGGTTGVWAACLLFFQSLLLAGYAYADWLSKRAGFRRQGAIHLLVLLIAVAAMAATYFVWGVPLLPSAAFKPSPDAQPVLGILKLLALSVGIPFLTLSATAPLLQHWYAHLPSVHGEDAAVADPPYYLYALSNFGSMLGLFSYPLSFEPAFRLRLQAQIWSVGFGLFFVFCATAAWRAFRSSGAAEVAPTAEPPAIEGKPQRGLWFLLAFLGSFSMLATTTFLTQDLAPIPLLWVLPLAVYLGSFMLVFGHSSIYRPGLFHGLFGITAVLAVAAVYASVGAPLPFQILALLGCLFCACVICHGELARRKPGASGVTSFYLILAAGGAVGGLAVSVGAPLLLPGVWEYHISLFAFSATLVWLLWKDKDSWLHQPRPWVPVTVLAAFSALPLLLAKLDLFTLEPQFLHLHLVLPSVFALAAIALALTGGPQWMRRPAFHWNQVTALFCLAALGYALAHQMREPGAEAVKRMRNFYGGLLVRQDDGKATSGPYYELLHGRITHGIQFRDPALHGVATTYYNNTSGVGLTLVNHPQRQLGGLRVGAVGLGTGTVAAYSRPGDVFRFYEINPAVVRLAGGDGGYFSFLKDAKGKIEIVPGDARLSLEAEAARGQFGQFDVLIVDAFNGDSIPVHLLTKEAVAVYRKHLRNRDSVLAIHISNRMVNLEAVTAGLADQYRLNSILVNSPEKDEAMLESDWVLMSESNWIFRDPAISANGFPRIALPVEDVHPKAPVWSDDYSNLISLLKWKQ